MSATITVDATKFNDSIRQWIDATGKELPAAIKQQAKRLAESLIEFSFPGNKGKAGEKIKAQVRKRFEQFQITPEAGKRSTKSVNWFFYNSDLLIGIAPARDMRKSSVDALTAHYYANAKTSRKDMRLNVPWVRFKSRKQQAKIIQGVVTTKAKVNAVAAGIIKKLGRLKAGWCLGNAKLGVSGTPAWVRSNISAKRGAFSDTLADKNFPSVTITNSARGVSSEKMRGVVTRALEVRAKAMLKDAQLYLDGVKRRTGFR